MKMMSLKKGEIATTLLLGAVVSGVALNYGFKEICGPEFTTFAREWITNPKQVGACTPCSKHVAEEMIRFIQPKKGKKLRVLEVGAGTGTFTRAIVKHLGTQNYEFDVIEINKTFSAQLQKEFSYAPKVTVYEADITTWKPTAKYDIIISALPFNIFETKTVQSILDSYKQWLVPGGRISYIELTAVATIGKFFMNKETRLSFEKRQELISNFRNKHLDRTVVVYLNAPPIYVHHLKI